MKKAVIAVTALAAAAAISVGAFLAVKSKSNKETQKHEEAKKNNVLFDVNSDDICKISITTQGELYAAEKQDKTWVLTECPDEKFTLNQSKYTAICTYISNLTAENELGALTSENKGTYGLDEPYIVSFSDGNSEHTLYLGDISQTGQYYYASTDKKQEVYMVPENAAGYILADPIDLRTDELLPYTSSEIVGIEVKRHGKPAYTLTFNEEEHMWELPERYRVLTVNQTRPSATLALLTRLTAETMYEKSPDDITTYGFDKPDAELTITAADGSKREFLIRYYGKDAKTYVHVYNKQDAQVATYYTADFSFIDYEIVDLVLKTVECGNMYAVTDVTFSSGILSETIKMDPDNNKVVCSDTELDLGIAELKSFYENFYNTIAYISIAAVDVDAKPELKDPIFSSSFTRLEGKTTKFDLVDAGHGLAYIFVNGNYTGTLTETGFLSEDGEMQTAYEMLCRHSDLEPKTQTTATSGETTEPQE